MSTLKVTNLQKLDGSTFPVGKISQVIQGSTTSELTSTSSSYADTGLTASITPTSTSSKVLIFISQNGVRKQSNHTNNAINIKLLRDSTDISTFFLYALYTGTSLDLYGATLSVNFLDTPASTSAITYKTQYANYGTGNIRIQDASSMSTITLMEVLA